jgi:SOS-response transcriptional repressor LexA
LGFVLRTRRRALGLSLGALAERVGCAKSYLSQIETGVRENPPRRELLEKLEAALALPQGRLTDAAAWQRTPRDVRREVESQRRAGRLLRELLLGQRSTGTIDQLMASGELRRLVDRIDPAGATPGATSRIGVPADRILEPVALPREVPLINRVAAGYPTEFTDLGYPARVADEYVRVPDLADPDAFAARVVGDSMEPEYREGDVVVFSPASEITNGADCFARLEPDHETTFKRVFFEPGPDGSERIRLQPLNSAYPPRVVARETVAGLYRAVTVMRRITR